MASFLWVLAVKNVWNLLWHWPATRFSGSSSRIPHEGPSLNALSILGYMNHGPNCCIDSYMPIDGSVVAIFALQFHWCEPVSCGSFRVIFAGFMLDKFTACGPQSFKISGVRKQS